MIKKAFNSLNSPIKRIGFIFFIIGVLLMFLAMANKSYLSYGYFIESINFQKDLRTYVFFGIGFYMTIAGLLMSFLYDKTVGRIINWIKKGSL